MIAANECGNGGCVSDLVGAQRPYIADIGNMNNSVNMVWHDNKFTLILFNVLA